MISKLTTVFKVIKLIKNWPIYFIDYMNLRKGKYIKYKLRNGINYKVRGGSTDRFIINEI